MNKFDPSDLKKLYIPASDSHKGQNGKVMIIGGSHLFHAASFWALEAASKIVDMVFYSSIPLNNEIIKKLKKEFRNGIVVDREDIYNYIEESDSVLIGPGLPRFDGQKIGDDDTKVLTEKLLERFPDKRWVVDGGSLQVISPEILPKTAIITPHKKEFEKLFGMDATAENAEKVAKKYGIVVLLKGPKDVVCSEDKCVEISGGNAGMTKGGTGDVLAGIAAALYAKNDAFLSASAASYINKKAGERLEKRVGLYFNASDLLSEIPLVMKELVF